MKLPRVAVAALAATTVLAVMTPVAAQAAPSKSGLKNKSLAKVLEPAADGFNKNWNDYNIVATAAFAVLAAKPESSVGVLAKGKTKLTAFVPTDRAFQRLVTDLTGKTYKKERKVYKAVLGLGVETVEQVLLYHVVPGARITAKKALKANGAALPTAQGATITVKVTKKPSIRLIDKAPAIKNPRVILKQTNLNKGNKQIAHGINRVLLPVPLTPAS